MKKVLFTILITLFTVTVFAQIPISFNIKSITKNTDKYSFKVSYAVFNKDTSLGAFANKEITADINDTIKLLDSWSKKSSAKVKDVIEANVTVSRSDKDVISGYYYVEYKLAGKDYAYCEPFNYGVINGSPKIILITDLFGDSVDSIWPEACKELETNSKATYFGKGKVSEEKEPIDFRDNFIITKSSVSFLIDPGVIAPMKKGFFIYKKAFDYNTVK